MRYDGRRNGPWQHWRGRECLAQKDTARLNSLATAVRSDARRLARELNAFADDFRSCVSDYADLSAVADPKVGETLRGQAEVFASRVQSWLSALEQQQEVLQEAATRLRSGADN